MSFLNPIAFWGLLALLIPFVIHLLSKKQKNKIYFGSNRFLADKETTSARSIQLSDLNLLLVRLLFLGSLIFAIADLSQIDKETKKVIYIQKSLEEDGDHNSILSQINPSIEKKYFSYERSESGNDVEYYPSAYTFLHKLNQSKDSITVLTNSLQHDFIGEQIAPNKNINWKILPTKETNLIETINKDLLTIEIINSEKSAKHKDEFKKVIASLTEFFPFEIKYKVDGEWKIMIDTLLNENNPNSIYWDTDHPSFSLQKYFDAFQMKGSLSKEAFLSSNFPLELTQILINSRIQTSVDDTKIFDPTTIAVNDQSQILKAESPKNYISKSNYLWLLAIVIILIERYLSLRVRSRS